MTVVLNGGKLTVEELVRVARFNEKVELAPEALEKIKICRAMVEKKIDAHEIMYGVNTGIGEFSETVLNDDQIEDFQKYLIYNHSAGIGDSAPLEYVRGALVSRINVHAHGNSGCRPEITQTFVELLNKGVTPFVCQKGSVGACGDLAPMSQIALTLLGEGEAYYKGELLPAKEAYKKAGIIAPGLKARDGLAAINGSNMLTAMSALLIYDVERWLKQAEIAAAMSLVALKANLKPYLPDIHVARGFSGAIRCAASIRKLVEECDLLSGKVKVKVQDAYSMRSTPQVVGAAHDAVKWAKSQVEVELSGVCDNPVFFPEKDVALSGANFQGTPVSLPMEIVGQAVTMVSVLSERRMNRLNNPALSVGLPPFLATNPGLFSGLMLSQYTADTQIVEQKILCTPASIQSIPAAADQEDFVSMGMNTAIKNFQIYHNACGILGIEFMAASQALDIRKFENEGTGVATAKKKIREHVDFLEIDRPLYPDHTEMQKLVKSNKILEAVEKTIGSLN